jgi:regulator of sirC expression with transglutaminase-like and TPR domain
VIHQLKGDILQEQGRLEEALVSFQNSLDLNPNEFYALRPHCQKALILAKLKRYEEALYACEVTLNLYPHQTEIAELRWEILALLRNNSGVED